MTPNDEEALQAAVTHILIVTDIVLAFAAAALSVVVVDVSGVPERAMVALGAVSFTMTVVGGSGHVVFSRMADRQKRGERGAGEIWLVVALACVVVFLISIELAVQSTPDPEPVTDTAPSIESIEWPSGLTVWDFMMCATDGQAYGGDVRRVYELNDGNGPVGGSMYSIPAGTTDCVVAP